MVISFFYLACDLLHSRIVRCPSHLRFLTAGPIDLKLCTYVPLGQTTAQVRPDSWLDHQGAKTETQKVQLLLN
jgi:hypothetical protein